MVGSALPDPIVVRALDDDGDPVPGAVVNFIVTSGGGSVFAPAVTTNAQGIASNRWTLGTVAGAQTVEVRAIDAGGQPVTYAVIEATALADVPASIARVGTGGLTGVAGQAAPTMLTVKVTDRYGNGVPAITVTWTALGGASANPTTSTTGAEGIATTQVTLPPTIGTSQVKVSVAGLPDQTFTGNVSAGAASRLEVVSGNGQSAKVGSSLAHPLIVKVTDAHGNPVAGAAVSWSAATGSGTLAPSQGTTNEAGLATATWTLGTTAGAMTAQASVAGSNPLALSATALAGPATTLVKVSGDGQNGTTREPLSAPIVLEARDAYGNAVQGVMVTWSVQAGGGSVAPVSSATGEDGRASTSWTLGIAGTNRVAGSASGVGSVTFEALASAPRGSSLINASGNGSFTADSYAMLRARLTTASGAGVEGASVTWRITSPADAASSGTTVNPGVSTTNANGDAETMLRGTRAGSVTVEALVDGLPPAVFEVTIRPGPLRSMRPGEGFTPSAPAGSTITFKVFFFDAYGNPVASGPQSGKTTAMTAHWTPAACGWFATTATDANLEAMATWTLCYVPGFNSVEIRITPEQSQNPGLSIVGTGPPTSILLVHTIQSTASSFERIVVTDDAGFIVSNTLVTFTITSGSGTLRLAGSSGSGSTSLTVSTGPSALVAVEVRRSSLGTPVTVTVSKPGYPDLILQR